MLFTNSILLARYLGPEEYGTYGIVLTLVTIIYTFFAFGYEEILNVYVIKNNSSIRKYLGLTLIKNRIKIYSVVIPFLFIGIILGEYIGFITTQFVPIFLIGLPYLFFYSINLLFQRYFVANLDTRIVLKYKIYFLILIIATNYILLYLGYKLFIILLANSVVYCLNFFAWIIYFNKKFKNESTTKIEYKINKKFGYQSWLYNILELGLSKHLTIIFLIYYQISREEIGYFNLASNIAVIFQLVLIGGFDGVGLALFSNYSKNRYKISTYWNSVSKFISLLTIPLLIMTFILSDNFISIFYGNKYHEASILLQYFLIFSIISRILGGGIHITVLYSIEDSKGALINKIYAGIAAIFISFILIKIYGIKGAIIALGLVQSIFLISLALVTQKKLKSKYLIFDQFKILLAGIIASIPVIFTKNLSPFIYIITFPLFIIIFMLVIILLKPFKKDELLPISNQSLLINKYLKLIYR